MDQPTKVKMITLQFSHFPRLFELDSKQYVVSEIVKSGITDGGRSLVFDVFAHERNEKLTLGKDVRARLNVANQPMRLVNDTRTNTWSKE